MQGPSCIDQASKHKLSFSWFDIFYWINLHDTEKYSKLKELS